jgi:nucleotide-binding universal stress UspA family protein
MCRMLVPIDFSEAALRLTREVVSWADALGGDLLLLRVVPDIYLGWLDQLAMTFIDQARLEAAYEELREQGQREFAAWLPFAVHARCRTRVAVGQMADTIVKVAQEEMADVIIMRAPQRRWWRPLLAGCVSDMVRRKASVPVVVWDGLKNMSSTGLQPEIWHPRAPEPLQSGAWLQRRSTSQEKTDVLKSR